MEEPVLIKDTYSLATPLHLVQKKISLQKYTTKDQSNNYYKYDIIQ